MPPLIALTFQHLGKYYVYNTASNQDATIDPFGTAYDVSDQVSANHSFAGPTSVPFIGGIQIRSHRSHRRVVWSPCNGPIPLNINNRVRLTGDSNSTGNGVLYDSRILDLALQQKSY
jgi:hypothetical protein